MSPVEQLKAPCARSMTCWRQARGRGSSRPSSCSVSARQSLSATCNRIVACHKGDPANLWIGVVDGLVKLSSLSEAGKSVTFAAAPFNSWFGEGSVLKREARKYDVVALRESRVALMPEATFFWLLETSIPFNRFILT